MEPNNFKKYCAVPLIYGVQLSLFGCSPVGRSRAPDSGAVPVDQNRRAPALKLFPTDCESEVIASRALSAIRIWPTAARLRYWLRIHPDGGGHAILVAVPEQTDFNCPICGTLYKLVRVEAPTANDKPLTCLSCGGPLLNREGKFALKYFRTNGGPGHRSQIGQKPILRENT